MIDFSHEPASSWPVEEKMSYLQRRIIVWSILYYEMDFSCVSDFVFDDVSHQLIRMAADNPKQYKKTRYYYMMKDFDGSTGFNLYLNLKKEDKDHLRNIAEYVKRLKENG